MRIVNLILSLLLVACIPAAAFCAAFNAASRLPDLYQFEFKSSEALKDTPIEMSEDETADFISGYMTGRLETFQIDYKFGDNQDQMFTPGEQRTMARYKKITDVTGYIGAGTLLLSAAGVLFLRRQNLKKELRKAFLRGLPVAAALAFLTLLLGLVPPLRDMAYRQLFNYPLEDYYVLPKLITPLFLRNLGIASVCLEAIVLLLAGYGLWNWTKPRRIFGNAR